MGVFNLNRAAAFVGFLVCIAISHIALHRMPPGSPVTGIYWLLASSGFTWHMAIDGVN